MPEVTTVEVLKRAAELLASGWCQNRAARWHDGSTCEISAKRRAAAYCLTGALVQATLELDSNAHLYSVTEVPAHRDAVDRLTAHPQLRHTANRSLMYWNDRQGQTQAEVVALVRETIACLK